VPASTQFISGVGGLSVNLAPDAFALWAKHYLYCSRQFRGGYNAFSPVPYFLLCRSIELSLKSRHLRTMSQQEVKDKLGHDLFKSYMALSATERVLDALQVSVLKGASTVYKGKEFEYFKADDALTGYKRFPDLQQLDQIAQRLLVP
jgi:hypothetical protein